MLKRFEGCFHSFDQTELFFQTWADQDPKGTLIITHGLAEHSECYHPLAKTLAQDGWLVVGWDLRGHGRSDGKRGFVRQFSDFQKDLSGLIQHLNQELDLQSRPWILFGHSMGGLITLSWLGRNGETGSNNTTPTASVLSSPALGLTVKVPAAKEWLAKIAVNVTPTLTLHNEIRYEDLSHDEEIVQSYARDNLRHDKISPGLFLGMVEAFKQAREGAAQIQIPVLFQLAGDDRIVSTVAAREFFSEMPNKRNQLIVYPESFHEIYNDLDRDTAIVDLKKFLSSLAGNL